METAEREFIFNDDNSLRRVPLVRFTRLNNYEPGESIPEYAGKRARRAMVFLEVDKRIPLEILHVDYFSCPSIQTDGSIRLKRCGNGSLSAR